MWSWVTWGLKPRMTVLAKISSLHDRPKDRTAHCGNWCIAVLVQYTRWGNFREPHQCSLVAGLLDRCQHVFGRYDRPSRHRFSWFSSVPKQMLRCCSTGSRLLLRAFHAAPLHQNEPLCTRGPQITIPNCASLT
jgi:hypothetical protein